MTDEKIHKEEEQMEDDASAEASYVPGSDDGDVLEEDQGVSAEEIHSEAGESDSVSDDGVHGFEEEQSMAEEVQRRRRTNGTTCRSSQELVYHPRLFGF